jgi:hypothetical protein
VNLKEINSVYANEMQLRQDRFLWGSSFEHDRAVLDSMESVGTSDQLK